MDDEEKKVLYDCLKIVICENVEKNVINEFAVWLCDNEAISKPQRKEIFKNVSDGFFEVATELLIDSVAKRDSHMWNTTLSNALADEDFPGSEKLHLLLTNLLTGKPVPKYVYLVIHSWKKLLAAKDDGLLRISSIWPLEKADLSSDWPLTFIVKCLQEYGEKKVEEFFESMKPVLLQIRAEKEQTEKSHKANTKQVSGKHGNASGDKESTKEPGSEDQISKVAASTEAQVTEKGNAASDSKETQEKKSHSVGETRESDSTKRDQGANMKVDIIDTIEKMQKRKLEDAGRGQFESHDKYEPDKSKSAEQATTAPVTASTDLQGTEQGNAESDSKDTKGQSESHHKTVPDKSKAAEQNTTAPVTASSDSQGTEHGNAASDSKDTKDVTIAVSKASSQGSWTGDPGDKARGEKEREVKIKSEEELKKYHSGDLVYEVEFRVVFAEGSSHTPGYVLYISTNLFGEWQSILMEKHEREKYYFCTLPALMDKRVVEYKYHLYSREYKHSKWEKFADVGKVISNRIVHEMSAGAIYQDVASFEYGRHSKSWHMLNQDAFIQHLPRVMILKCDQEKEKISDFLKEVLTWMRNVKKGWEITYDYKHFCKLSNRAIETALREWLEDNARLAIDGGKMDIIRLIVSTLALITATYHENVTFLNESSLKKVFQMLGIHRLDAEYQKILYVEIIALCEAHDKRTVSNIQEVMLSFFRRLIDFPMAEFLLALPLYWLITDGGCLDSSVVKLVTVKGDQLLHRRSGLPSGNRLDWSEIKQKCSRIDVQRALLNLSKEIHEIYQTHPWIAGSYHYFLSEKSLVKLIKNREMNMIGDKFALDSVFHHLLNARKLRNYTGEVEISDLIMLSDYFICTFQNLLQETKSLQDAGIFEEKVDWRKMTLSVNILSSFRAFFVDLASHSESYNQTEDRNNGVLWCLGMTSHAAKLAFALTTKTSEKIKKEFEKANAILDDILHSITRRMFKCRIDDDQLNYWSRLMTTEWHNHEFEDKWRKEIKSQMEDKINKTWKDNNDSFLTYYTVTLEKVELEENVEACFRDKAFACTEKLLSKYRGDRKDGGLTSRAKATLHSLSSWFITPRFVGIFDKLFNRELDKASQGVISFDMQILLFLFSWTFAPQFYRLFYTEGNLSKFSFSTKERISRVLTSFLSVVACLKSGDILVEHLKMIIKYRGKFFEVFNAIENRDASVNQQDDDLSHIIDTREMQLTFFEAAEKDVRGFLSACTKLDEGDELKVHCEDLKEKLRNNFDNEILSRISSENVQPASFFGLTSDTLNEFCIINFIKDSKVFHEIWHLNAVKAKRTKAVSNCDLGDQGLRHISWYQVLEYVWKRTKSKLITLVQTMDEGTLALETVNKWFCQCDGSPEEIAAEVKCLYECYKLIFKEKVKASDGSPASESESSDSDGSMQNQEEDEEDVKMSDDEDAQKNQDSDSDSWKSSSSESSYEEEQHQYTPVEFMDHRIQQMCNYFQLQKARETIAELLRLKNELKLNGDFSSIEMQQTNLGNKGYVLGDISDDQDVPFVCKIPQDDVDVLKLFIKEKLLISWLKEKMRNISEVKVMCDLAMISAGESSLEVDTVSCLLSSVMGFAPLIFELDETSGLDDLLRKCEVVWKNRDTDAKLLEKWKDTGNQLPWFKGIENFHGSVEKQSLTLAQEINKRGIYTIRRKNAQEMPTVKNCIELALPDKDKQDKPSFYQLDGLCDLQSKLMLIAGEAEKGQTDVFLYVDVLTSVQILARTLVKLSSVGCMLFNNWSAVITCQDVLSSKSNNLLIQVRFADDAQPLTCTGSIADLTTLSTILNDSLERWNDYISLKRMEHYFLNEFNIQQIIYLCHELAICENGLLLPDQVTTLLSYINPKITLARLHSALDEATKIIDEERKNAPIEDDSMDDQDDYAPGEPDNEKTKMKAVNRALQTLKMTQVEDMSISEDLAKAAIHANGYEDLEKCLDWIAENHDFDEDIISQMCVEYDNRFVMRKAEVKSSNVDKIEEKNRTVRKLIDQDSVEEDLAKAAVQSEGYEDYDNCLNWTLLNQFETDKIERLCEEFDQDAGFAHQERQTCVIRSVLYNRAENTLKDVIDRLQENSASDGSSTTLMNAVHTICSGYHDKTKNITLKDSLSIEHLGRFFHLLHEDGVQQRNFVRRELMQPLQTGRPNLLICAEQEILPSTLSLYMFNKEQPLPTTSEVLICSERTSADEVERFMRRAMCKCDNLGQLLFVLAFADKLSFNVSTATEKIFSRLCQDSCINSKYQLVILLSKQQHYLTTCFDKYLIEGKWISSNQDISNYLEGHLKVTNVRNSAACVDKKHSSVKIVTSTRSGVGKSLHIQRLSEQLHENFKLLIVRWYRRTIRLLERTLDNDYVIRRLYGRTSNDSHNHDTMLIHLDLTPAVQQGIETFAFNLFVLGSITDSRGKIWKRHPNHLYMVEMTDFGFQGKGRFSNRHILNLLPSVKCIPPREVLAQPAASADGDWLGMDQKEFFSDVFQRPYQYLKRYEDKTDLDSFIYTGPTGDPMACTHVLLKHCCMNNPSWAQLRHFAGFLNVQLQNCENSIYCDRSIVGEELRGLKAFAVKFMIRMSQDFATPSLNISDESSADYEQEDTGLKIYQLRRKWEESTHPYLFFNEDKTTMTFINVNISDKGDLLDKNCKIVEPAIISKQLVRGLKLQRVSLDLHFDTFSREKKLEILCLVMGIQKVFDPDPTYELTTDNVLKILAIYMRFRCQIPVIIMGETGCGKTRMIEFMSRLKAGPEQNQIQNMITLKIHGGITVSDIHTSVHTARNIATDNKAQSGLSTVLFYDEANTTEAIYAVKEVMCDLTIDGDSFQDSQLKLVAACNPYKQLSKEAIRKLEDSGLGYHIRTSDTTHLFGNVPMRTLVYRVVALPPSMQPFVWDFGQLSNEAEGIYIQQMTKKLALKLNLNQDAMRLVSAIFSAAQRYMRSRRDECRYVSLRDVERCVITYEWFYNHKNVLYPLIEKEVAHRYRRMNRDAPLIEEEMRTLLQTIGVCYHASLDDREGFRNKIQQTLSFKGINISGQDIREEITAAQTVFLHHMKMENNIASNEALQENVFMMTVCADMKIPLFLIGKPGSSKSLAKTIVGDNMQGATSQSPLYKKLKQVHILSYQCSALTDAVGIESVFKQCAQLQTRQDLSLYSAVVVLDEIGLAEDSPNMPLKVLHPLLECGSTANSSLTDYDPTKKVGFVGISNWALDPAKMNRGIFVTRNKPNKDDLKKTAKGIFENHKSKINENLTLLDHLTDAYLKIYENQKVEYFGLRDYYSLIKMIHFICTSSKDAELTAETVANAIHRNFSGGKTSHFGVFKEKIAHLYRDVLQSSVPIHRMISDNLHENGSRFLLLLTNQFSASSLLNLCMEGFENNAQVVFGSSFPGDHNYTDICRNINRIKVCMETGKTVVLLNMAEIHESLYDALNQHYVTFGGQKYVDLGLGGHRVKCRIADNFRLIVVEQKEVVYSEYPIPLINRLEKHHLNAEGFLSSSQSEAAKSLTEWSNDFTRIRNREFGKKDAFVGFHEDTICSVVLTSMSNDEDKHKGILLQSAAMDAIFRLPNSDISGETESVQKQYLFEQCHDSLLLLLRKALSSEDDISLYEITSYSNILSENDRQEIEAKIGGRNSVMLLSLQQFETEHEYMRKLDEFFGKPQQTTGNAQNVSVLLIQCSQAQSKGPLIACAKYCLTNKMRQLATLKNERKVLVAFLLSTERECESKTVKHSLLLQHVRDNRIVYVDELRPTNKDIAAASHFYKKSLCEILQMGLGELENGECENSLVNIVSLLRDCVCEAVKKVKSQLSKSERYFERVKILTHLCTQNEGVGVSFRKILLEKMIQLYTEKEEQGSQDWIVAEACNRDSLQEGGTFRKTLWLCLRRLVSKLMAYIVSIVERHDNLNLLSEFGKSAWKIDMWLKVFQAMPVSWSAIEGAQDFHIVSPQHHKSTVACNVPFSYALHDFFTDHWNALTNQQSQELQGAFYALFRKSPLFEICSSALNQAKIVNMMKLYASDLINNMHIPGSDKPQELEVVKNIIHEQAMKKFMAIRSNPEFRNGDQIALVFLTYKDLEKYLKILSDIFKACPDTIHSSNDWIEKQGKADEFLIHVYAFKSILQILQNKAQKLQKPESCLKWRNLMTAMKHLFDKIMHYINNEEMKRQIIFEWTPVALVDLFLRQLLPSTNQDDQFKRYLSVIAPQAKLMWRGVGQADVRSYNILRIMSNVLRRSFEDMHLKFIISWAEFKCRHCSKPKVKDPTFLPCGHFICETCLVQLTQPRNAVRRCPKCAEEIPQSHVLRPATLNAEQERELENFKSNCMSFFMEYLRHFCFSPLEGSQKSVNMEKQVEVLVKELVVQAPEQHLEVACSALDLNINAKSSILRILLNNNFELVVRQLNNWLNKLDKSILRELTTVIIKCFEHKLLMDVLPLANDRIAILKRWEAILRAAWRKLFNETLTKVETLQVVAEIRSAITVAAGCIQDIFKCKDIDEEVTVRADKFITFFVKIITNADPEPVLKEFIVKVACRLYGTEWFHQLKDNRVLQDLVPDLLKEVSNNNKIDRWLLLGKSYTDAKTHLYQSPPTNVPNLVNQMLQPGNPQKRLGKILAILTWSHKEEYVQKTVTECLQKNPDSNTYFLSFLIQFGSHFFPDLKSVKNITDQQVYTLYQLITLVIAMVTSRCHMMDGFIHMLTRPSVVANMFLPAMPEDPYFSVPAEYRCQSTYKCPNGHIYTIGQCTRPMEEAKCLDCGATIGGKNHQAAAGNVRYQPLDEKTQVGYLLNKIQRNVSDPADRLSKQGAAVLHFLLHACMLFGLDLEEASILRMLGSRNKHVAQTYLIVAMLENLQSMSDALARNMDDTILVLYSIILRITNQRHGQQPPDWSTLEKRREWEAMFRSTYLLPIFQDLDKVVMQAQGQINAAEEDQRNVILHRAVYEVDKKPEPDTEDFAWNNPMLWETIEHSSSARLLQHLGDSTEVQEGVMKVILNCPDLYMVKYLEPVLQLQSALIQKYQNNVDMNDTENIKLRDFMRDGGHSYQEQAENYIFIWNQTFRKLKAKLSYEKRLEDFFEVADMRSPISMFLPSTRGRGQCAKLFAEHLIDIQNDFLTQCKVVMKLEQSIEEAEVPHLFHSHFVRIDKQEDLLPLIHLHTRYIIITDDRGRHHHFSFNIDTLEKQTREQFIMHKKLIAKQTLPCIQYPQDIGIGPDWDKVLVNTPQVQLPAKIAQDVDRIILTLPSADVCEGVRTLAQAISFLAKIKSKGNRYLCDFLEKDLLLPASRMSVIPKSVQIEHALSLYSRLSWHKAVHFSNRGLIPYKAVLSAVEQVEITDEKVLDQLLEVFEHSDVVLLQQRLNEMLIKSPDFNGDWSLTVIFPYFYFIGDNGEDDSWYARLPDEILFKHVAHLFSLTAQFTSHRANPTFKYIS